MARAYIILGNKKYITILYQSVMGSLLVFQLPPEIQQIHSEYDGVNVLSRCIF
jgi:hypothetical protein